MQQCLTVDSNWNANVFLEGGVEPSIFVLPSIHHPLDYFVPQTALKVPCTLKGFELILDEHTAFS